ncbi:MAG TPA: sensor histidine kinase [Bryobacteraceae bacterium]|nr:sensor histidine kinase [Bryobacteraceae bacterium]
MDAVEQERARIARELHAGAGQPLAAIKLNLELLEAWSQSMPADTFAAVERLKQLADVALEQIRSVSHRLHPPRWQELRIEDALRDLIDRSGIAARCDVSIDIQPLPFDPPLPVKVTLYRCAQESLSNVLRHAGASRFGLRLEIRTDRLSLRVSDNGRGFIASRTSHSGIGLKAIRENVKALGGFVRISTGLGGTTILVGLPLDGE